VNTDYVWGLLTGIGIGATITMLLVLWLRPVPPAYVPPVERLYWVQAILIS